MRACSFDEDWRFYLEKNEEAPFMTVSRKNQEAEGYAARFFNDAGWQSVTLPHDWGMTLPYTEMANHSHGHYPTTPVGMDGQVPGRDHYLRVPTKGWYRKTFFVPREWADKCVCVAFDGIYRDARVWINGQYIDRFESGYIGFRINLTDNLYYGEENTIAVCADSRETEGWWYEGAGIYRHAHLLISSALHLDQWAIRTTGDMHGRFTLRGRLFNDGALARSCEVRWMLSRRGETVLTDSAPFTLEGWSDTAFSAEGVVSTPALWSTQEPNLYQLNVQVVQKGEVIDEERMNIGFRTFRFDAREGLFVNEVPVKIKGACNHQDFAGVGVALPDALHEYKIRRLKEMGCNAYRSSHHAPSPEIVDACDRLGMLLMDETRMFGSTPSAMRELLALVRRDRNHACVLMWSIGNEEHSVQNTPVGARIAQSMIRAIRREDDTRPITYGGNNGPNFDGINAEVDIRGVNYVHIRTESFVDEYHRLHPHQPMYGSEETSIVSTRGEYRGSVAYPSAYGECAMPWASTAEGWWKFYSERAFLAGGFMWTGFDYFGEPTPYERNSSTCFGAIDLCGFPKDMYYYYRAWWQNEPVLHLFPHWNAREDETVRVVVYSNLESVALYLNGRLLSKKDMEPLGHLEWEVPFEAGTLEAVGYREGREVLRSRRVTAGVAAKLHLRALQAAPGSDIYLIRAEVTDENGTTVPDANNLISFRAEGGRLLGVGNGDPASREANQFGDVTKRMEILDWKKKTGDEWLPWDAFKLSTGEHGYVHTIAKQWTREENKEPFRDPVRIVARSAMVPSKTHFEAEFETDDVSYHRLDFALLEGNARITLNGREIGSGNNKGWPCSFPVELKRGQNRLEVDLNDTHGDCGIYNGVWLSKTEPCMWWRRSAFHGLALAIVKADHPTTVTAVSEGLTAAQAVIAK